MLCGDLNNLGEEIKEQYLQLSQALDEYVRKVFNEWTGTVDKDTSKLLDLPLMKRSLHRPGMLDINFDRYVKCSCGLHTSQIFLIFILSYTLANIYIFIIARC